MTRLGAVDVGTNSTRLLIADIDGPPVGAHVKTLDRRMRITRLGQGVHAAHALAPEAIDRTVDVLREYRVALDDAGVERVRATATSAARDATNRDAFFELAEGALGVEPELLTGDEEARLSFLGATADLDAPAPYLVVDIGGGSTELVVGTTEPEALTSIDTGCVRVTEQFLASDPPAPEELSDAVSVVRDLIADAARALPGAQEAGTLVGLAGTVTTVAAIELGLVDHTPERTHHFTLTKAAAEDVFRTLATESHDERRHNPGLDPGRVDVIVGGSLVLVTLLRTLGYDEMLVSESDILDGLVLSQA